LHILFAAQYYFANPDMVKLSTELARRKHRVSVITSFRKIDRCRSKEGISIIEIKPLFKVPGIPYVISTPFSSIYKFVREEEVEVIHALMDYSLNADSAAIVARLTGVPFIYSIQGIGTRNYHPLINATANLYDLTVRRWVAGRAKKIFLLSKKLFPHWCGKLGIRKGQIVVLPSGVDYTYFDPNRPEIKRQALQIRRKFKIEKSFVVGFVGRLVPAKGLTYLIKAVGQLQSKYPGIVLLVVGAGSERAKLETMTRGLKVKTIFAGWQAESAPYYAAMDIFVLPSLFEGLPNVVLEAMSMEKPIVATNVGGNADLISSGTNGFLVPKQDHLQIAFALEKLIQDGNLRKRMGVVSRQKIMKSFSWNVIVPKIEKVYCTIAKPKDAD